VDTHSHIKRCGAAYLLLIPPRDSVTAQEMDDREQLKREPSQ